MFCRICGNEINNEAVICVGCGCLVDPQIMQPKKKDSPTIAVLAMVFSIFVPLAGLIFGILGTVKYETRILKQMCTSSISISIAVMIMHILLIPVFL